MNEEKTIKEKNIEQGILRMKDGTIKCFSKVIDGGSYTTVETPH